MLNSLGRTYICSVVVLLGLYAPLRGEDIYIIYIYIYIYIFSYMHIGPPQSVEHRYLEYHYMKYMGPPQLIEHRGLEYCYTKQIYRSSPVNLT